MNAKALKRKDQLRRFVPRGLQQFIRSALINETVGSVISRIFRDRIPHRGCLLNTASARISPSDKAALFFQLYERSEIDQISAYVEQGVDVVELGGSIGASSIQILRHAGTDAKVIIVEADAELCAINQANLDRSFPTHQATVIHAAIGYTGKGDVVFTASRDSKAGHVVQPGHLAGNADGVRVPEMTLSQIVERYGLAQFTLVCDIEGAEVGIFVKEEEALKKCRRIIAEIDGGFLDGQHYSIEALLGVAGERQFTVIHRHANRIVLENSLLAAGNLAL